MRRSAVPPQASGDCGRACPLPACRCRPRPSLSGGGRCRAGGRRVGLPPGGGGVRRAALRNPAWRGGMPAPREAAPLRRWCFAVDRHASCAARRLARRAALLTRAPQAMSQSRRGSSSSGAIIAVTAHDCIVRCRLSAHAPPPPSSTRSNAIAGSSRGRKAQDEGGEKEASIRRQLKCGNAAAPAPPPLGLAAPSEAYEVPSGRPPLADTGAGNIACFFFPAPPRPNSPQSRDARCGKKGRGGRPAGASPALRRFAWGSPGRKRDGRGARCTASGSVAAPALRPVVQRGRRRQLENEEEKKSAERAAQRPRRRRRFLAA